MNTLKLATRWGLFTVIILHTLGDSAKQHPMRI